MVYDNLVSVFLFFQMSDDEREMQETVFALEEDISELESEVQRSKASHQAFYKLRVNTNKALMDVNKQIKNAKKHHLQNGGS